MLPGFASDSKSWFRFLAMDALRARGVDPGTFPW
jgi:hypothetical protein